MPAAASVVPPGVANGVILAENDTIMRGIIRAVLARVEQRVFQAADGLEAVALARQFKARLVLLDIDMPRLNGLLACEAIHALPGYEDVPLVILTGYNDDRLRMAAHQFGAVDFICKPFQPNVLLARLTSYLNIPARALPAEATMDDVGSLDGRATVWRRREQPRAAAAAPGYLIETREILDILETTQRAH
jgi:DNA-binding response OmpR family regulator